MLSAESRRFDLQVGLLVSENTIRDCSRRQLMTVILKWFSYVDDKQG